MELVNCIVNTYTTHYAFRLIDGDDVFIYDNGHTRVTTYEQYLKESKIV
ncbi:hypothetical protein GKZ28_08450 [Clostridium chromiireducens]|jgi:hypothetical protein|uniref:Uncharacterized protein n=1 Tax=Clostridium chromiireducens TaxID=225345 RepID=A0A964RLG7_9CLOT|nr:hypothetical protein [Clostridium chromiireducens]MVX63725.1 hypothetical protein [Clostridium chromiireducens]